MSEKIRVAVFYGGRSGEHEISLVTASNVMQNLDNQLFDVIPVGIDKSGNWFFPEQDSVKKLAQRTQRDQTWFAPNLLSKGIKLPVTHHQKPFDVVFPAVHGSNCEDGTLQGLLELADIPYVGCGVLASALGMDKDISKRIIQQANIKTAKHITFKKGQWFTDPSTIIESIETELSYPIFVKPCNTGSSVGISKIKTPEQLIPAIEHALEYDLKILVEETIVGRELEIAVLESLNYGAAPTVSVVGEIIPRHDFYSYEAKYLDQQGAELVIPANLDDNIKNKLQKTASQIFGLLDCEGMARVDLFLTENNDIYFNEVNTIPGFTQISMYPKLMEATGIPYSTLLTHLIKLAIMRHTHKSQLRREYHLIEETC